jgi:putative Holliday junction resolvase
MTAEADLPRSGRLLGLDVGERRIGVAVSDPDQGLALPAMTLTRGSGRELAELASLIREKEVVGLVVGLPVSLSGEEGEQAKRTREFARDLRQRLNLPVAFWDERLSSQEAERILASSGKTTRPSWSAGRRPEKGATDLVAATIILQAYLDSRRGRRLES